MDTYYQRNREKILAKNKENRLKRRAYTLEYSLKLYKASPLIECACGCRRMIKSINRHGKPVRYIKGHHLTKHFTIKEREEAHVNSRKKTIAKHRKRDKIRHYRRKKIQLMEVFGNKCENCGIEYNGKNASIYEFHHNNPVEKDGLVSRLLADASFDKALAEAKKCKMLCRHCHTIHHNGEW